MKLKSIRTTVIAVASLALCSNLVFTAGAAEKAALPKKEVKEQVRKAAGTGAEINLGSTDLDMTVSKLWQQIEKVVKPHLGEYTLMSIEHSIDGKTGKVEAKHIKTGKQVAFTLQGSKLMEVKMATKAEITWTKSEGCNIIFKKSDGSTSMIHCLGLATTTTTAPAPTKKTAMIKLIPPPSKGS